MMKNKLTLLFILITLSFYSLSQESTQTIRGVVNDKQSLTPIIGAIVKVVLNDSSKTTVTDVNGQFRIDGLIPGRYDVLVMAETYKNNLQSNVILTIGKEVVLEIFMEEQVTNINEVVISASKKHETINELATTSARSFSTEEVNRYAGGRSDPSRMAANFAGVSSPDDSRNDLVIRGNSPAGVLWRVEGLAIPNPNHFATIGTTGGPVSALNTNVLKNSDFFTSAFPAEYGNATAGVFDLGFRKGNAEKRENMFQIGALTGLEGMTEGPLNKKKGSSYLLAYRYSFAGAAQAAGLPIGTAATPFYQDISFKINGGQTKLGKFVLFGLAGKSTIDFLHNKIDTTDLFANPTHDSYFTSKMGLVGVSQFYRVNSKAYFKTVLGLSGSASVYNEDTITKGTNDVTRTVENQTTQLRTAINSAFSYKYSSKLFFKFGVIEEVIGLKLFYRGRFETPTWHQYWDYNNSTSLTQLYAHVKYSISNRLTFNGGLHAQYLALNQAKTLEPRAALKFAANEKSNITLGYGLHSQMQPLDVYFIQNNLPDGSIDRANQQLDFTKSHQVALGYEFFPAKNWRVKAETYYQYIYNVPVTIAASSYSMLNAGASFYPNNQTQLKNTGKGRNYGVELTIEKFFSQGYYCLITGSVYNSRYKGSDGIERNTAFNGKFVYNILAGKEFKLGPDKRNTITLDFKLTQAGGRYYTPVDLVASQAAHNQVLMGDSYAFTQRNPNFFRVDFKVGYTWNSKKRKLSQSWYFDVQNIFNHKNVFAQRYNPVTNQINTAYQIGFFPNFVYKLQF